MTEGLGSSSKAIILYAGSDQRFLAKYECRSSVLGCPGFECCSNGARHDRRGSHANHLFLSGILACNRKDTRLLEDPQNPGTRLKRFHVVSDRVPAAHVLFFFITLPKGRALPPDLSH